MTLTLRMSGWLCTASRALGDGDGVEVDDADGLAALLLAADVHLGDVDACRRGSVPMKPIRPGRSRWVKISRVPSMWASSR